MILREIDFSTRRGRRRRPRLPSRLRRGRAHGTNLLFNNYDVVARVMCWFLFPFSLSLSGRYRREIFGLSPKSRSRKYNACRRTPLEYYYIIVIWFFFLIFYPPESVCTHLRETLSRKSRSVADGRGARHQNAHVHKFPLRIIPGTGYTHAYYIVYTKVVDHKHTGEGNIIIN